MDNSNLAQLHTALEAKVSNIVNRYDANALVVIKLTPKSSTNTELPSTPFTITKSALKDEAGTIAVDKIDILIISGEKDKIEQAKALIERVAEVFGPKPEITFEAPPQDFQLPKAEKIPLQDISNQWEGKVTNMSWIIAGIMIGSLVLGLILGLAFLRSAKKHLTSIDKAAGTLSSAIQESGGGGTAMSPAALAATGPQQQTASQGGDSQNQDQFKEMTSEGILALLSDCYWCKRDAYASFIWKRLSSEQQRNLISKLEFLKEYVAYVAAIPEHDAAYARDPYYLSPLDLNKVDIKSITEAVREEAGLLNQLSNLRLEHLELNALERLELRRQAEDADQVELPPLEESEVRELRRKMTIRVSSLEEEEKLLNMKDIDIQTKEEIPSLIWLYQLAKEDITTITQGFGAKDLASAWIAPEKVLEAILDSLPAKKRSLLENYTSKITPSRDSGAYLAIHQATVRLLQQKAESPPQDETGASAA